MNETTCKFKVGDRVRIVSRKYAEREIAAENMFFVEIPAWIDAMYQYCDGIYTISNAYGDGWYSLTEDDLGFTWCSAFFCQADPADIEAAIDFDSICERGD